MSSHSVCVSIKIENFCILNQGKYTVACYLKVFLRNKNASDKIQQNCARFKE